MIDARRMEVFTALYNDALEEIIPPSAVVLQPDFLAEQMGTNTIFFAGNGASKWMSLVTMTNAMSLENIETVESFSLLAAKYFQQNKTADLAYAAPFYCKAFYQPKPLK
jgi:tRNA threonylcarbamoyladenosine biosynthesis protein TsaB